MTTDAAGLVKADYGEPWVLYSFEPATMEWTRVVVPAKPPALVTRRGLSVFKPEELERARICVNALAGLDPAAIAGLLAAIQIWRAASIRLADSPDSTYNARAEVEGKAQDGVFAAYDALVHAPQAGLR